MDSGTKQGLGIAAFVTALIAGGVWFVGSDEDYSYSPPVQTVVEEPSVYYTPDSLVEEPAPAPAVEEPESKPEPRYVYYPNCASAPGTLYAGEPGYSRKLDRDGDGVACE